VLGLLLGTYSGLGLLALLAISLGRFNGMLATPRVC
jgi:hypothetical protein